MDRPSMTIELDDGTRYAPEFDYKGPLTDRYGVLCGQLWHVGLPDGRSLAAVLPEGRHWPANATIVFEPALAA